MACSGGVALDGGPNPAAAKLDDLPGPLHVVVVIGPGRTGKSTLCNKLVAAAFPVSAAVPSPFKVDYGEDAVTCGVDAVVVPRQEGGHYLILDCEGTGNGEGSAALLNALVAVCFCMSSTHVVVVLNNLSDEAFRCAGRVVVSGMIAQHHGHHPLMVGGRDEGLANLLPAGERPEAVFVVNRTMQDKPRRGTPDMHLYSRLTADNNSHEVKSICEALRNTYAEPMFCHWQSHAVALNEEAPVSLLGMENAARHVLALSRPAKLPTGELMTGGLWVRHLEAVVSAAVGALVQQLGGFDLPDPRAMVKEDCKQAAEDAFAEHPMPELNERMELDLLKRIEEKHTELVLQTYNSKTAMWGELSAVSERRTKLRGRLARAFEPMQSRRLALNQRQSNEDILRGLRSLTRLGKLALALNEINLRDSDAEE